MPTPIPTAQTPEEKARRLALIQRVISQAIAGSDTLGGEDRVGVQIAYLAHAISTTEHHEVVDWSPSIRDADPRVLAAFHLFKELFPADDEVRGFIRH